MVAARSTQSAIETPQPSALSFADYLQCDRTGDPLMELVEGRLEPLEPLSVGTGRHGEIADHLAQVFRAEAQRLNQPWTARVMMIGVRTLRGIGQNTARIPDVVVLPIEQWRNLQARVAVIDLDEPPPLLVVEVVSESTRSSDYRAKQAEYAVRGIPEYWIVDPLAEKVSILTLSEGWYDSVEITGEAIGRSALFPELTLSAQGILTGGL
jgi:Uma2 family endonuclease